MSSGIKAVTFDLWDTIFIDGSDEPRRRKLGLRPKKEERLFLLESLIGRHVSLPEGVVRAAHGAVDRAFGKVWREQAVTWTVAERMALVMASLDLDLPEGEVAELVGWLEAMEGEVPPDLIPGVAQVLQTLSSRYKLAIISDAVYTPGRVLRQLLDGEGLLDCFDALIFSDEAGCSKPDAGVFRQAAEALGVELSALVHVGDREHNDIKGAHGAGARAVLLTLANDRDREANSADAVCARYEDLPAIIEKLGATDG